MITLNEKLEYCRQAYDVVGEINLDTWHNLKDYKRESWLRESLQYLRRDSYQPNQRIVCTLSNGDSYAKNESVGDIIKNLQRLLSKVDITNCFVVLVTNETNPEEITNYFNKYSSDGTSITVESFNNTTPVKQVANNTKIYEYNSYEPIKISFDKLTEKEVELLVESKVFCVYPWIHLHAYPTGEAYPCCGAKMNHSIGNVRKNTLSEIWNSPKQRQLRTNMLNEIKSPACENCYEQEDAGFFSMRRSANKHHGHQITRIHNTHDDGHLDDFQMTYWDIRFSNLCNLSCRSCGHIFSSSWYQDQAKLAGSDWKDRNTVLNYAGRTETDMWEQLIPHLDYVEQIYFAGGEPLMMSEHYNILDELERRGRFDVRLIYNTNFTHTKLKDRTVFDYWRKFDSVAVGASLDAMGPRAEYIRKGTDWDTVERNREQMLKICPAVDFYISPTLSIMNALHLPDFHRDWVEKGLLKPQDLNVNILQGPEYLRIDIAPVEYKQTIQHKYEQHLEWLRPLDKLTRATVGFESAITFMNSTDNTQLLDTFWRKTQELDSIRREHVLDVLPELRAIK